VFAKSTGPDLERFVRELPEHPLKMAVLGLLDDQVKLLLHSGKTDYGIFCDELRSKGISPSLLEKVPADAEAELEILAKTARCLPASGELVVVGADFHFPTSSLTRLEGTTWLDDNVILACLHLSDKLPYVRVGFCIPMHQQARANVPMPRPFERAGKKVSDWRNTSAHENLVSLFPLLQHGNHFSLLEINEKERCIYHYDSLCRGENATVKAACAQEFPQFHYFEKVRSLDVRSRLSS